jgi:hypothetical protein
LLKERGASQDSAEERKRELAKLAKRPDSEIDFSDIPELTEKFWQNAVPNPFYRPVKKQVTCGLTRIFSRGCVSRGKMDISRG